MPLTQLIRNTLPYLCIRIGCVLARAVFPPVGLWLPSALSD
jgi:TRAP-type mannitol/chloroaromatic compound transport system permease large subunit